MSIPMSTATPWIEKNQTTNEEFEEKKKRGRVYLLEELHDNIQRTADGSNKTFTKSVL